MFILFLQKVGPKLFTSRPVVGWMRYDEIPSTARGAAPPARALGCRLEPQKFCVAMEKPSGRDHQSAEAEGFRFRV